MNSEEYESFRKAITAGDLEEIKRISAKTEYTYEEIYWNIIEAITSNYLDIVKFLSTKVNIHLYKDELFLTAVGPGHLEMVKYFVETGSVVTPYDEKPLRRAMNNQRWNVAKYLVEMGANWRLLGGALEKFTSTEEVLRYLELMRI